MAYYSTDILEEELKNRVAHDWFSKFDNAKILGKVDFCICRGENNLIWAEAKKGTKHDIYESFVQLILTIGKERTFDDYMPPAYLCAFDAEKIAFIEYHKVMDIFSMNDFNWKVTPSDHSSVEFKVLQGRVQKVLEEENLLYYYDTNEAELKDFIKKLDNVEAGKFQITKNNFIHYFHEWEKDVKPSIGQNWDEVRKEGDLESDFYLADLLSENNITLKKKLTILLKSDFYIYNGEKDASGARLFKEIEFNDNQKAHRQFWSKYERPPKADYWEYIVSRRDLLVPVDVRERKGSFFTPRIWVEKSQEYLAKTLGEDWQDEYYVWDCCAGTGNLLVGLSNKYRVFASTLDKADVDVIKQTMVGKVLVEENVFQFDFLNDNFTKLPKKLQEIINDEQKRKKLVIYINPPYAEAAGLKTPGGTGTNKAGVAKDTAISRKYKTIIKGAANEIYALFLFRIFKEIPGCIIANFSTIKLLQGQNFSLFLDNFTASLNKLFVVPAYTFDNVNGHFPIGFFIWNTGNNKGVKKIKADIYDKYGEFIGKRVFGRYQKQKYLLDWANDIKGEGRNGNGKRLAFLSSFGNDVLHQRFVCIVNDQLQMGDQRGWWITPENVIPMFIFLAVRQCIKHTWLNNRDQYLYPQKTWKTDTDFQTDCLAFILFHMQNRVSSAEGINHFIPFKEEDVEPRTCYNSHFLIDYISGKSRPTNVNLFNKETAKNLPIVFSPEAQAVMDCAKELYIYYHQQENANTDASFYDIRLYFQGTDAKGRMNPSSNNNTYNDLLKRLREAQKILADKIATKVYEHGFLEE